jgi:hypothetical protein
MVDGWSTSFHRPHPRAARTAAASPSRASGGSVEFTPAGVSSSRRRECRVHAGGSVEFTRKGAASLARAGRPGEIHVCRAADGDLIGPSAAPLRFAGLILAALPLFVGFLTILVDDRRRGVHDMLAGTVVVPARPEPSP